MKEYQIYASNEDNTEEKNDFVSTKKEAMKLVNKYLKLGFWRVDLYLYEDGFCTTTMFNN